MNRLRAFGEASVHVAYFASAVVECAILVGIILRLRRRKLIPNTPCEVDNGHEHERLLEHVSRDSARVQVPVAGSQTDRCATTFL